MHAWRLFKRKHAATDLLGEGARLNGGRYNSVGVAVIYTSASLSLAAFEILAHVQSAAMLNHYSMRRLRFSERLVTRFDITHLPAEWRKSPPSTAVQQIGDHWVDSARNAVLQLPSALIPQEMNFILNPAHPNFRKIIFEDSEPFIFPPRIVKALRS